MNVLNPLKIGSLSVLFISLTACQAIPKAKTDPVVAQPNLPINTAYAVYDNQTVSNAEAKSIAGQRWQDFYTDNNLKQLIAIALENNKDIQSAVLSIQKARAAYQISDNSNIPTVGLSGSMGYGASEAQDKNPSESYNVGLSMSSYEFDFWGKIANQKESALQSYFATGAAKDTAQISLISSITQSYVAYSYNIAKLQLALDTLKTREESLNINKKRFQAGLDSELTSVQAQSLVDSTKISIANLQTALLQNQNALRQLVGTEFNNALLPKAPVKSITNNKIFSTGLPSDLLYYRPDIRQAEYNLKAKGADIAVARANFFPSISLSANTGTASSDLSNLFKSGTFSWGITPSVSIPIFNRNLGVQHEVAEIDEKIALSSYEKTIQTAFKEVNDVLATRATLNQKIAGYESMKQANAKSLNIANARFKAGLDNYLGVLDAMRSQYSAEESLLTAQQDMINSQIELYQVLGGGVNTDVALETPKSTPNAVDKAKQLANKDQSEK